MDFNIWLKFEPEKGLDGLALDYDVLGKENFEEICRRYIQNFSGKYARREDLGGIGNVDYLIGPHSFYSKEQNNREKGVLAWTEFGEVYYYPLNLFCSWISLFLLDTYRLEDLSLSIHNKHWVPEQGDRNILVFAKECYFSELKFLLEQRDTPFSNKGIHSISSSFLFRTTPLFFDFKDKFMNSFSEISKYRTDLFFAETSLDRWLEFFKNINNIKSNTTSSLEEFGPSFFNYMAQYAISKSEKSYLGILEDDYMNLQKKKSDIYFKKSNILEHNQSMRTIHFSGTHYSRASKYPSSKLKTDVDFTNKAFAKESFLRILQEIGEYIDSLTPNPIAFRVLIRPLENNENKTISFNSSLEVLYFQNGVLELLVVDLPKTIDNDSLFIAASNEMTSRGAYFIPIQIMVFLDQLGTQSFHCYEDSDKQILYSVSQNNDLITMKSEDLWLNYFHILSESLTYYDIPEIEGGRTASNYSKIIANLTNWNNDSSLLRDITRDVKPLLKKDLQFNSIVIEFSTIDLSLKIMYSPFGYWHNPPLHQVINVKREGEYVTYDSDSEFTTVKDEEILNIYKSILNYAFQSQSEVAKKYGSPEYILEISIEISHSNRRNNTFKQAIISQTIKLLTDIGDEGETINIENQRLRDPYYFEEH